MECPANNNVVIKRHKKRNQDCTESNTFKQIMPVKIPIKILSPLNIGLILQTEMGPCLWNWPRMSSM